MKEQINEILCAIKAGYFGNVTVQQIQHIDAALQMFSALQLSAHQQQQSQASTVGPLVHHQTQQIIHMRFVFSEF